MDSVVRRLDVRVPLRVTVDISSLDVRNHAQEGLTENVSAHGARVVTSKPLPLNEKFNVRSLLGSLRSRARVVYCEPLGVNSFAIGLQMLAVSGEWNISQKGSSPNSTRG
jgi:hypothetical protein